MTTVALVIAGGDPPVAGLVGDLGDALVIAADGGVGSARALGLAPATVIGDLDSARTEDLAWARAAGAEIVEHPADKDRTDLELALDRASALGVDHVVVVGLGGGRSDHLLGNWAVVCAPRSPTVEVRDDAGTSHVVHDRLELTAEPGRLVSILPWGGEATVSTSGLAWELSERAMSPVASLGVSNVATGNRVTVEVHQGTVVVVLPSDQA